jgi:hypothetical protein
MTHLLKFPINVKLTFLADCKDPLFNYIRHTNGSYCKILVVSTDLRWQTELPLVMEKNKFIVFPSISHLPDMIDLLASKHKEEEFLVILDCIFTLANKRSQKLADYLHGEITLFSRE